MSRNSFTAVVEVNGADIELVNRKLKALGTERAGKAMKSGFRKWTKKVANTVKMVAPLGNMRPTEKVRGEIRPNPHIRDFITTKVKGYSKGTVVWAAVGVKEIRGSYTTPHWYLRWVEFGHELKRRATAEESIRLVARGERRSRNMKMTVGRVRGKFFMRKAAIMAEVYLLPIMEQAIADQVEKEMSGG